MVEGLARRLGKPRREALLLELRERALQRLTVVRRERIGGGFCRYW
jgi:hypothetical protein